MRIVLGLAAALCAAACVGDAAELGGVTARMEPPATTIPCDDARLTVAEGGKYVFPGDALLFYYGAGKDMPLHTMSVSYDVTPAGEAVNIRYTGPEADTRHATKLKLIRAAVDGVRTTKFAWPGEPGFAVGCSYAMDVMIRIHRDQI
jgi:hypothetical protein